MSKAGGKAGAQGRSNKPTKKTNRDKVNDEIIKIKRKGKGNKTPLILAGVGLGVLIIVGIVIFMFMGGDNKQPLAVNPTLHQQPPRQEDPPPRTTEPPDAARIRELVAKLDKENDREAAVRELMEKVKSGGEARLKIIMDGLEAKAKSGVDAAIELLKDLAKSADLPLAQSMANERLDKLGIIAHGGDARDEPTNFLPYDTQTILTISPDRILRSDYSRALFTFGAFRHEDFENRIGINLGTIEKLIIGCNKDHGHVIGIIRTSQPYVWEEVKAKLQVGDKEYRTSKGKPYFMGKVDILSEFLNHAMPPVSHLSKAAAIYKKDDRTLIYGDEATIKEFIDNPPAPRVTSTTQPSSPTSPSAPDPGMPSLTGAGSGGPSIAQMGGQGQGGAGTATPPTTQDSTKPKTPPPPKYQPYMTIDNKLRQLIELAEDKKESLGMFADSLASNGKGSIVAPLMLLKQLPAGIQEKIDMMALAVTPFESYENPSLRGAFSSSNRTDAELVRKEFEKIITGRKDELKDFFSFDVRVGKPEDESTTASSGGGPVTPPTAGGGDAPSSVGGGGSSMTVSRPGTGGAPPSHSGPATPTTPDTPERTEEGKKPMATVDISRREDFILVVVTVLNRPDRMIENQVGSMMVNMRTMWEMSSSKLRIGNLAQGVALFKEAYSASNDRYVVPMGAYPRPSDPTRGPRPFPPHERVSWMPHLLNYLPSDRYQGLQDAINYNASWRDPANVDIGRVPISAFLNPSTGSKHFVRVRGISQPLAVTDFVGMAGVGPDAPYYAKADRRAGFFGYDRQVRVDDVRDGMENTIFMIQSDSSVVGPWIAGGGSTIRGTSEKCDRDIGFQGGFSSPNYKGNAGAWVIMGDGSARFLTKDISPKVFEALCTINGGDDPGLLDSFAPRERLETTPITRSGSGKSTTPERKKPTVVEEEDEEKPTTPPKKP